MSDTRSDHSSAKRHSGAVAWLLLLLVVIAAGGFGWYRWQAWQARQHAARDDASLRLDALEQRLGSLRREQQGNRARLQRSEATNRVLREELLGMGERAALLEDSLEQFADPDRHGAQALRLDEAELLLGMGRQRLRIAGDLDGARRAYALAAGVLSGVDDPAYLSLRQTLAQERAALDALGADPRARALVALQRFAATLQPATPRGAAPAPQQAPWWRRAFGALVDVQPSHDAVARSPSDRAAARIGLQLELSLARAAAERRDATAWQLALARAGDWLPRLWPDSPRLQRQRERLRELAAMPLSPSLETLGSTLAQLRQLRGADPLSRAGGADAGPPQADGGPGAAERVDGKHADEERTDGNDADAGDPTGTEQETP